MTSLCTGTVVDRLCRFAGEEPGRVAISATDSTLTRGDWDRRARAIAAQLRPGTRVLVLLPSSVDFFIAFAGVLYAGACAVPVPPPVEGRTQFVDLALDADVAAVVTTSAIASGAKRGWVDREAPPVHWVELDSAATDSWSPPTIDEGSMALLQYTSGSTGAPKGVAVSHRVLATWLDVWADRVALPAGSSVVTWVPAHHVLGLSFVLMAPWLDGEATLLTPQEVVADPLCWLRAVSDANSPVLSGAPPFGYRQCVDAVPPDDRLGLDLSGWEVAVIGSERIRPQVLDDFAKAYAPTGFQRSAFFIGYGTTETMMGSAHRGPAEPVRLTVDAAELEQRRVRPVAAGPRTVEFVACGPPGTGLEMIIVDPESRLTCGDGEVGELWMRGPAVAEGYWHKPEQTEQVFRAWLADGSGPYLRTGDLAFFHQGELVVCGRLSELIIIRGRNLIPHDIESTVRATDPLLADAAVAAFSVEDEWDERLVVVAAIDAFAEPERLAARVRRAVTAEHEVAPDAVLLVGPDQIPLTPTGKVRHGACRKAYLDDRLSPIASATEPAKPAASEDTGDGTDAQESIRYRIGALLGIPALEIPVDCPLIQLGLDSLQMIKFRAVLESDLGLSVPTDQLPGHTVATLATDVTDHVAAATRTAPLAIVQATPDPEHRYEPFGLTDLQHAYLVGRSGAYPLGGVGTHFYAEFDAPELDHNRLHAAWRRLVERHDMLRAVISSEGDQRIRPQVDVPAFLTLDLRDADARRVRDELDRVRVEMSHQVFAADQWPLFDIRISRLPGGVDRVHVSLDLLVLDVWSLHIISREWRHYYQTPERELSPLALTFRDYVVATDRQAAAVSEPAREYWLDRVDSLPAGPELPLCCPPAALTGPSRFTRRRARLNRTQWTVLSERAMAAGLTPSSVLLAAYATVLGGWGRRSRFTLNLPTFNRLPLHPEIDSVVGDFTSVTLLEVDLADAKSFVDLATRLQRQLWQDLAHTEHNGVRILRDLARRRGAEADTFAPVVFSSASGQTTDGQPEMPLAWLGDHVFGVSQTPQVLIDHQVIEDADGLEFNWDTVDELFAGGAVDDMFTAYRTLLARLAGGGGSAWRDELPELLPGPHRELVLAVNATGGDVPDGLLHEGVVEQARRTPDRTAVIGADAELTFGDLYRHSCRLAASLRMAGVRPNQPIAVSLPKGAAQVVAALGVLLAGGAYLPVDPELPAARQDRLLELGGCRLMVYGGAGARESWPAGVVAAPVDLAGDPGLVEAPETLAQPDDLAYVIFTSGSTGEPKGVAVSHRAALNTCVDICDRFDVGPADRVLGLSSLSFDLSVWDIFGVLGAGGAVVLPESEARRDPARWLELVRQHEITVWNSVPALAQMFADYVRGESVPLRLAMLSGDWIPVDLPDRIRALAPECRVVSLGGATEAAVWSIFFEVGEVDSAWESIPYGRPLRNQRFHVLNDRWQECPVHVAGELFIGGVGLAQGYFGDQERTAAAFATHPETGERLYRTGDLGRWRPDGTIEFLGREDFQVKIGGYRIELGEIEAAIADHPGVRAAVVAALGDRHHQRLVACVIPAKTNAGPRAALAMDPERFGADDRQRMIFDEIERVEFKLARHGVRTDLAGDAVPLASYVDDRTPARASQRRYADRPVAVTELAALLAPLRSHDGEAMAKYAYASAGNSYAVQTYLHVADGGVDGLAAGTYYHDPVRHRLVPIRPGAMLSGAVRFGVDQQALDSAAFTVFFVAAMDAVRPLYGSRAARDLALIETGLMAALLEDRAAGCRIGLCQLSVIDGADSLRESFQLDGGHEVLHAVLGGARLGDGEQPAARDGEAGLISAVREHLADRLPGYMVPAHIVLTESLPLTPTGKVDRGALEHLVAAGGQGVDASPPADELEASIAEVFQQVLEIDTVGVHAGFFDLGADSTAIVRAYRQLQAKLGRRFPLTDMFEHASVRKLATALSGNAAGGREELLATAGRRAERTRAARRGRGRGNQEPSSEGTA